MTTAVNNVDVIMEKVKADQKCHKSTWTVRRADLNGDLSGSTIGKWINFAQYSSNDLYLTSRPNKTLTLEGKALHFVSFRPSAWNLKLQNAFCSKEESFLLQTVSSTFT